MAERIPRDISASSRSAPARGLVAQIAEVLRGQILSSEPGERIGSLKELAQVNDVGIVTIQQVARLLEQEGLLEVRRGPGGGYFGRRPDIGTVEGMLGSYLRGQPASWEDALDLTSLLFIELCAAASSKALPGHIKQLDEVGHAIAACDPYVDLTELESRFQELLFEIVDRPLFELLTRVTLHVAANERPAELTREVILPKLWQEGRDRIIAAIVQQDPELARFEATRWNRDIIVRSLKRRNRESRESSDAP